MRRASLMLAGSALVLLAGCATPPQPLYYWGDYQGQVHGYFKGDKSPEEQILALEAIREKARAKGLGVPPGLQAHLGLLYGQTGRSDRMLEYFAAEKTQFPESSPYLDFLLKNKTVGQAAPAGTSAPATPGKGNKP